MSGALSDGELVERARGGDSGAFGELWERHHPAVRSLCRGYLPAGRGDPSVDEEDLTTESFIRALHHLHRFEDRGDGGSFGGWVAQIARHACLDWLARQRSRDRWTAPMPKAAQLEGLAQPGTGAAERVEQRQLLRAVAEAVHALPELYRAAFKLFLEEYSHPEIARALGISPALARKRVERARGLLQPQLAGLLRAEPPRRRGAVLRGVERELTSIVSSCRIVLISLPGGGELQLYLRVDRALAGAEREIAARRARLCGEPVSEWRQRLELADICFHCARWKEARQEYRRVLAANPGCVPAALRLGEILRREQQPAAAARVYRAALRAMGQPVNGESGSDVNPLTPTLRAALLLAQGKHEEAAAAARAAIALAQGEKESYYLLHEALAALNRYEEQLDNLARLREVDRSDLFGYVQAYTPCARLNRFAEARSLLERALELDPNDPAATQELVHARMNLGLHDDAETLRLAEQLVRLAPGFVTSWSALAWVYAEQEREEESLAVVRQFAADHPQNAEAHAAVAWRFHYLRRPAEAWEAARQAYELAADVSYICWTALALCHDPNHGVPAAEVLPLAAAAAARFPDDSAIQQSLASLYLAWSRPELAMEHARRAVALAPASFEARLMLATVHRNTGQWPEAAAVYEQLVRMPGGDTPQWLSVYGEALRRIGDPRAGEVLERAYCLLGENDDDLLRGRVYEAGGRRDDAIRAFRRVCADARLPIHQHLYARLCLERLGAAEEALAEAAAPA